MAGNSEKSNTVAALLCFFLGCFGIHRFYVGKVGTGVLQLITLGGLGIWALIDFIMIVLQKFTDGEGNTMSFN
jgi:TM2 domain-containing membrane protein YozV